MIIISWVLIISGLLIRLASIIQMNKNNVWKICAPKKLLLNGVYKYIRHPMYLGGILFYVGMILISTKNILVTLVFLGMIYSFVMDRIDREENLLSLLYGDIYRNYILKTNMLIPFLL